MKPFIVSAILSLHVPESLTNSFARSTSSFLNCAKLISGGGRCNVKNRRINAVPHESEMGLNDAEESLSAAVWREARSSEVVEELEREMSWARVATAAIGIGSD